MDLFKRNTDHYTGKISAREIVEDEIHSLAVAAIDIELDVGEEEDYAEILITEAELHSLYAGLTDILNERGD